MSRTGQKPLEVPRGVEVKIEDRQVEVKGPKGSLSLDLPPKIGVSVEQGIIRVVREDQSREAKNAHGLIRSLIRNMCTGVSDGFVKTLEIQGVGFNAEVKGGRLLLNVGFPKPVEFPVPEGVLIAVEGGTVVIVSGSDNQKVGDAAAKIRGLFPVEPYKGKGIRYRGESVRRKVGKKVA